MLQPDILANTMLHHQIIQQLSLSHYEICFFLFEYAFTRESLLVTKNPRGGVYSGSTCKQGEIEAVVIATGAQTFFGKAAHLVESTTHVGHFQKGALTKRMTAIEEMVGMDVLCSDKMGILTLNTLTVDKNIIEVFAKGVDREMVVLMAARASRLENQDAIDYGIASMLVDPKEVLFQIPNWFRAIPRETSPLGHPLNHLKHINQTPC